MTNDCIYKAGASVIANNPDLRSDSGQFAQIAEVPVGSSSAEFFFVATTGKDTGGKLPKLTFKSLKGISYPGGGETLHQELPSFFNFKSRIWRESESLEA